MKQTSCITITIDAEHIAVPRFICVACGENILDLKMGNAVWNETNRRKPGDEFKCYFVHKGICDKILQDAHGEQAQSLDPEIFIGRIAEASTPDPKTDERLRRFRAGR